MKLDDEFLMSSLFPVAEIELARLGMAQLTGDALDAVVGGLGLATPRGPRSRTRGCAPWSSR
ncbi:hypothetical protein [Micromonospora sp. DT47]|uniref:hypothetical protein n=1 Tax=Micromonospora sp. DT47 TaxID=3393431 RepID=UPI003CE8C186